MEKPSILLVEDDRITIGFLRDILEHDGYEVTSAENGRIALERLQERLPDLILSDVMMPEMNGIDLFHKVQADDRTQNLPFIFLTTLDDADTIIRLKESGTDDYLTKPVRPRQLLATLKGRLLRKQRRDEQAERERDRLKDKIRWTLSHELRTPLTIIQGISELLLNEGSLPKASDYQELLQNLRSQSFQLGSLIENFLLVTRIDAGVEEESYAKCSEPLPIRELVEEVAFPLWDKAKAQGLEFLVDAPDGLPAVHAHHQHLSEVFRQVLDNAFKFADPQNPRVTVHMALEGDWVRVQISDNGRGISGPGKELVFQKLSQIDREIHEQQGSGLGLYIAKRLVDINRGRISLTSEPDKGTEVNIHLPVAKQ